MNQNGVAQPAHTVHTIYIVEDDPQIRAQLCLLLEKYGYCCLAPDSFENVAQSVLKAAPHLVLLDINLPLYDGYHVCREIRAQSDVPIIIVTSRDSELDELMSMNLGADDFITKPYHTQILLARIASLLKRAWHTEARPLLEHKGLTLDLAGGSASFAGRSVELSKNELRILRLLMEHQGVVVSRDDIMNDLWQSEEFIDDNTLTVNVNRLRRKLESIGVTDFLHTRRGQGYLV